MEREWSPVDTPYFDSHRVLKIKEVGKETEWTMGEAVHGKLVIKRGSCRNPNSLIPALTYITRRHSMWILKGIESRKRGKSFLFFPAVCEYEYVGREKRVNKRMCGRKKSNIAQHPCCCCPRDDCVPRQSPLDPNFFFFFFWLWWVYEKRRAAGSDCRNDWATLWELFGHQWQVLYVLMKLPVVCVPLIEDSPPPSKKGNKQQTTCCCKTTTCGFFFLAKNIYSLLRKPFWSLCVNRQFTNKKGSEMNR